ncbi:MAG: hypothetical protein ACO22L_03890 [Candidatus Nanopelagicaceae bacterium]
MSELKINRGVELMLRGERPKDQEKKPEHGVLIYKVFTLLRRKVYFNFELRWGKEKD